MSRSLPVTNEALKAAAFIDVETTGVKTTDEIIELSVALFTFDPKTAEIKEVIDSYTGLREPSCPINPAAARVNHITWDMVEGQCLDDAKVLSILERAEFIVAHNATFEKQFLLPMYPGLSARLWLCSLYGIDWRRKGHTQSRSLQTLLETHSIKVDAPHRAESDVNGTLALLRKKGPDGKPYFAELVRQYIRHTLTESEQAVFDAIRNIIDPTDNQIGFYKTDSYVAVGYDKGAYWFTRFKWGPRAKYLILNGEKGSDNYQRVDVSDLDGIQQHADALRSAFDASVEWRTQAETYARTEPKDLTLIINVDDILKKKRAAKVDPLTVPKAEAPKKGRMGCLAFVVAGILLLMLLGKCLG